MATACWDFLVCIVAFILKPRFRSRSPWWRLMTIPWDWSITLVTPHVYSMGLVDHLGDTSWIFPGTGRLALPLLEMALVEWHQLEKPSDTLSPYRFQTMQIIQTWMVNSKFTTKRNSAWHSFSPLSKYGLFKVGKKSLSLLSKLIGGCWNFSFRFSQQSHNWLLKFNFHSSQQSHNWLLKVQLPFLTAVTLLAVESLKFCLTAVNPFLVIMTSCNAADKVLSIRL